MSSLSRLFLSILTLLPSVVLNPVFWAAIFIVFGQYARMGIIRERMLGARITTPAQETVRSLIYGLVGGGFGSVLLVTVGVTITEAGLAYIWPVALLLMLFSPRFLCFSYAGGIVALTSLLFGFPKVGIPELLSLIAILHGVESVLIFMNGSAGAVPVFTRDRTGRTVGGFLLQKFWPISIVVMIILTPEFRSIVSPEGGAIQMPEWWPLIKPRITAQPGEELLYSMFAIPAALGYGDIALAHSPAERSRASSLYLLLFSAILLALAVTSGGSRMLQFAAALFSPIGHELVIWLGRKMEYDSPPAFVHPEKGMKVLYVMPGKPADKIGIRSGDVLLALNGRELSSRGDIESVLAMRPSYLCLDVERRISSARQEILEFTLPGTVGELGIMFAPELSDPPVVSTGSGGLLARLFRRRR